MLIASPKHGQRDMAMWREYEESDLAHGKSSRLAKRVARSLDAIKAFGHHDCYAGVSWGKDSVVMAHLIAAAGLAIPLVWIKQIPLFNPDCETVRDAFLGQLRLDYHEIEVQLRPGKWTWHATGSIEEGFRQACDQFGQRHVSGVRAGESYGRLLRMRRWGVSSKNACAPIGWWTEQDVFGYLAANNLPVHPCYAFLGGGRWNRDRIRTCRLDGRSGDGIGRAEWEREYYADVLNKLAASTSGEPSI